MGNNLEVIPRTPEYFFRLKILRNLPSSINMYYIRLGINELIYSYAVAARLVSTFFDKIKFRMNFFIKSSFDYNFATFKD